MILSLPSNDSQEVSGNRLSVRREILNKVLSDAANTSA